MLNHPIQPTKLKSLLTQLAPAQQALLDWIATLNQQATKSLNQPNSTPPSIQTRRAGQCLLLAIATLSLLLWDWKLLTAFIIGLAAMALVWTFQNRDFTPWLAGLRHWLNGPYRLLLLCVPCGSVAMLGTYMAASIWDDSHSAWLVSCILLQGIGMTIGLTLLSMQFLEQQGDRANSLFDDTLAELTHPNPLNRLIAVRQLNRLLERNLLSADQTHTGVQALQLLLLQEPEALVREATLRSLDPGLIDLDLPPLGEASLVERTDSNELS